ncbi:hypothetical protein QP810_10010 [Streptococcus agalactiae]|uniref:hypothetical protein n=1 Tax=Streptococcus agalactiae TaxID=1311 RepID=UPI00255476D0|nr:hypothetical protein [Streptococcus agalactiae]MDK8747558.1 hypothetical protein [Streptococcus agalactiae]
MLISIEKFEEYIKDREIEQFSILSKNSEGIVIINLPLNNWFLSKQDNLNCINFDANRYRFPIEVITDLFSSNMHVLFAETRNKKCLVINGFFTTFEHKVNNCSFSFGIWDVHEKEF